MQCQFEPFCSRCAITASGTASGAWLLDASGRRRRCRRCHAASAPAAAAPAPPPRALEAVGFNMEAHLSRINAARQRFATLGLSHASNCQLPPRQCRVRCCGIFKAAIEHVFICDDLNCRKQLCRLMRGMLLHCNLCNSPSCSTCAAGLAPHDARAMRRLARKFATGALLFQKFPHLRGGTVPQEAAGAVPAATTARRRWRRHGGTGWRQAAANHRLFCWPTAPACAVL